MKIHIEHSRRVYASNSGMYYTSDGYYSGETITSRITVFLENDNISLDQAFLIFRFIKSQHSEESDSRMNGPKEPQLTISYSSYRTEQLVQMLGEKYIPSDNKDDLIDIMPICRKMIEGCRDSYKDYLMFKQNNLFQSIQKEIENERIYLRNILFLNKNSNEKIKLDSLEKLKSLEKLLDWKEELKKHVKKFNEKIDTENCNTKNRCGNLDISPLPLDYYFINKIDNYMVKMELFAHNIRRGWGDWPINLRKYSKDDRFEISPIDLSINIENCEILELMLKNGANEFIDVDGLINLCLKHHNTYIFSHDIFPLRSQIENNLINFIINIVRYDFSYALNSVLQIINNNHLLSFVLCLSIELESYNIFNHVLELIDVNDNLIRVEKYKYPLFRGENEICGSYYALGISRFSFIKFEDYSRRGWTAHESNITDTLLQYACKFGNKQMIISLINKNVTINTVLDGQTAYDTICYQLNDSKFSSRKLEIEEIRLLLLENGAVSVKDIIKPFIR